MGYLDEAIRDHLALQRKRGVPSDEIERAEAEALGPVGLEPLPEPVSERATAEAEEVAEPADEPVAELEPDEHLEADEPVSGPPEPLDQPTQAFSAVDAAEAEGKEGEDVLEETPEFLQETPEHDRLWFEQKPPKDFDFS
ncbi:MAG: hypothetical protein V9E83_08260 [Baekduia sp.]